MTSAVKRMVALRFQLAFLMRTIGGKGGQFLALTDDEEPEIAELIVQSVGSVDAEWTSVDRLFRVASVTARGFCECGTGGGQNQELAPVHALGCLISFVALHLTVLILEHETRDDTPMDVVARRSVDRENEGNPQSGLHPADRFQVRSKTDVRDQTALAVIRVIEGRLTRQFVREARPDPLAADCYGSAAMSDHGYTPVFTFTSMYENPPGSGID